MFSWMNPKLVVKATDKYGAFLYWSGENDEYRSEDGFGNAVVALSAIKKDEVLVVMGGHVLTIDDEDHLEDGLSDKPIEISVDFSIGPRSADDLPKMPQHYINHSCDPNAGFDGQVFIVAMRDIEIGEEICYDYAMIMCSNDASKTYFSFNCKCGTNLCRSTVAEADWQRRELQARYHGYFSHAVNKLISK